MALTAIFPAFSKAEPLADLKFNPEQLLRQAQQQGREAGLPFAGSLSPQQAWALLQQQRAVLVDVRTAEELKFVGRVPGSQHVAWQTGPALLKNPRFLRDLEKVAAKDQVILLLCRSGKRSAAAAEAAARQGFSQVYNVLEGFEGDLGASQQRGEQGGWKHWNLPWIQD